MSDSPVPDSPVPDALAGGAASDAPASAAAAGGASTRIDDRILRVYAVRGALSVPGVVSHASGINRITGRRLPRAELRWDAGHRSVSVDLQIAVAWPSPVVDVAAAVRETAGTWVTTVTGIPVSTVNVEVSAVVPVPVDADPAGTTVADLGTAPRTPDLTPVTAAPLTVVSPTVTRGTGEPVHPTAPERRAPVPVLAGRPASPTHVTAPDPAPLHPVEVRGHRPATTPDAPLPAPPVHVAAPVRTPVTVPADPVHTPPVVPGPPVRRPTVVPAVPAPPVPAQIVVGHTEVTVPVAPGSPAARGVLRDIPTPRGPQLRNIPTPDGLPVRAVPTPTGLPLTVYPQVRRRGVTPVTVTRHPRIPVTVDHRDRTGAAGAAGTEGTGPSTDDRRTQ